MIKVVSISLENDMDLVLAHKRSMKVAERLGLTIATQTTFATAVSEIARTVIEHTDGGQLEIGLQQDKQRYSLQAIVKFDNDVHFTNADAGFYYAQKLVPQFNLNNGDEYNQIEMLIGLPRSLKLDPVKINLIKKCFEEEAPINAYEEIKQRNITLNKIADQQEEEIRQSKLIDEKKTEFISIASHELKTPMTVLKAYTQMANMTAEPISEQLKGILSKIDLQSTKLLTLVQQLLDISKIENGSLQYNMKLVSLNEFVQGQLNVMQQILPYHQLSVTFDQDVFVHIDELRLEQVFSNLLGNAAKYSEKNSVIQIVTNISDDNLITIEIIDKGKGISSDDLKSIFGKFYRAKDVLKTHSGLGMGLYVTSKIVTDHGGTIWAESVEKSGSTFYFTLPFKINQLHD
jgi:signal transduction histidine kinase